MKKIAQQQKEFEKKILYEKLGFLGPTKNSNLQKSWSRGSASDYDAEGPGFDPRPGRNFFSPFFIDFYIYYLTILT